MWGVYSVYSGLYTFRIKCFIALDRGWSCVAEVLCIIRHWGIQLILAYNRARPAILVAGKGRGGMFLFLLFLHFHSCSSFFTVPLFHLLYFSISIGLDKGGYPVNIFFYFSTKTCCGYSLEAPLQGASNEYHNICFREEIRKISEFSTPP